MTRMLTELADVLRAIGLTVHEATGIDRATGNRLSWKQLGRRKSGVYNTGYEPGLPTALMEHHTASRATIASDLRYMNDTAPFRPITNLYWPRNGEVYVCAAGPTNTNGAGEDKWGGGVPDNRMNEYAIGNEIANTGVGEPYPQIQQDAVMAGQIALADYYSIPSAFVRGHFEWTSRKIDPFGPSRWSNGQNAQWDMASFRAEIASGPIDPGDDDMKPQFIWRHRNKAGAFWVCDGSVVHLDGDMRDTLLGLGVVEVVSTNTDVWNSYTRVARGIDPADA